MKKNNWAYFIVGFIIIAIMVSSYFYPRTRDEFYYLPVSDAPNPFTEFYNSYQYTNPRIGQFFSNLIGRNPILKPLFNLFLTLSYLAVLFLILYRRLPKFKDVEDIWKFLILSSVFIYLINYFGEMFFYVPYNSNYTLTHIFYLLYLFLISEYYFYNRNLLEQKKVPYFLVFIGAFFMGWCNEHVPPVLLAGSFLLAICYFLKNRKLPDFKILSLIIPVALGYLVLFFAPANSNRFEDEHISAYRFQLSAYLEHCIDILRFYYYYNFELSIVFCLAFIFTFIIVKKISSVRKKQISFFLFVAIFTLLIAAYSPIQGTRLLFFSNSLFCIIILIIADELRKSYPIKAVIPKIITSWFLICFFSYSIFMTWRANANYNKVMAEIQQKKEQTPNIVLEESFDYVHGWPFARKILLESGQDYIKEIHKKQTSQQQLLIHYFQIKSLTVGKNLE